MECYDVCVEEGPESDSLLNTQWLTRPLLGGKKKTAGR